MPPLPAYLKVYDNLSEKARGIMAKMGRPKAEKPKNIEFGIRLDKETADKLIQYCEQQNVTKGEGIRRAIMLLPSE